jgi:hypothetical protein
LKAEVLEHGFFKCFPSEIGIGDAADGALDDAGVGGAEAIAGALEADGAEAVEFIASEALAGIGRRDTGDPDGAEGVNGRTEAGDSPTLAEDGVVEGNRVISDQ